MEGCSSPSFAQSPPNSTHVRPQNMYCSDTGVYLGAAPLTGAPAYATSADVPMGSHCHDSSGGQPIIDGGMGDTFTEPAVYIAGTQGGGPATVNIDDEGATRSNDAIPRADRGKRAVGEERGGRGGQSKGKARVRGPDWTDKESMAVRGHTNTVTDDEDIGGGSENGGNGRTADSDSAEGSKSRRTGGASGHNRHSAPETSADASRGGSFANIAHALVDANDRHPDKIAGSFVHAMDGMNKTTEDGNRTLLQCFAILSGAMVGLPPECDRHCHGDGRANDGR
ncbi:hypothetical protein CBR_g29378 [Chara braunii]|uniref:Uncharacterized protein n=1 Tax=Chara braunii TaxID=69332 RepID=A0A388JWK8_CHABU|nr:hypothetical protein CBR_g29378 [Chara braunii]|eukprot:GBG62179.1 hypothetical protein CBR_g29378 [Chara braunii]